MNQVFEPFLIRDLEIRNRLLMSAMVTNHATRRGEVTNRLAAYHRARSRGGVGLIETEASYVNPSGKGYLNQLGVYSDELLPGLKWLARTIHAHGAKAAVQLFHAGRRTSRTLTGREVVAPSPIACYSGLKPPGGMVIASETGSPVPKELSRKEIGRLVDDFARAALRAREAGFDAVSLHAGHGYLISSFLSPFSNKRSDAYGGDREGRCRFLIEIIEAIRAQAADLPILVKISGDEFVPGGLSLADTREMAPLIERAGADAIIVSASTVGQYQEYLPIDRPSYVYLRSLPLYTPRASYLHLAQGIRERVKIPVAAVGRINDPALIREIIEQNKADLVVLGRALLADPDFPLKMQLHRESEIRPCIACNQGCLERLFHQKSITCAINPGTGREHVFKPAPSKPKRIAVIGGGPAGLEAARLLCLRGHEVTLLEAAAELGGQLNLAWRAPHREEMKNYLDFLLDQVNRLPIKVMTGVRPDRSLVEDMAPDVLILATGARPRLPDFVACDEAEVITAEQVLRGRRTLSREVIVAGGGLVGCEVAELLAQDGGRVTIVEMKDELLEDEFADVRRYFENVIARHRIEVLTGRSIVSLNKKSLVIRARTGREVTLRAGAVVLALGYASTAEAGEKLTRNPDCRVFEIGDRVKPGKIIDAVDQAYRLAMSL